MSSEQSITIEIRPTNRYLRLWMARWQSGRLSGVTDPVPADILAERVCAIVQRRLEELDHVHDNDQEQPSASGGS
jgi:hypothetical protein